MTFDPNQPFEVIEDQEPQAFDPSQPFEVIQGGEIPDEEIKNQPQANLEGDASRSADQQITPVRDEADLQDSVSVRPKDQGQRGGDDQARVIGFDPSQPFEVIEGGEVSEVPEVKQADAEGGKRPEAGQGLSGEVPTGDKTEVIAGGVQPSPAKEKSILDYTKEAFGAAYKGLGTAASETQRFAWDLIKPIVQENAETAEAVLGPNIFSEKVKKGIVEKGDKYFSDLVEGSKMTPEESKHPINQFSFGIGHMIGDLATAAATMGVGQEAKALQVASDVPVWKTIADKAISGMKAFTAPSLVAANSAIDENKAQGKSDAEALAAGMKTLIESEAAAAVPMQVSSGLDNVLMRGASRVLQSMPLAVAQQDLATAANNVMGSEADRKPTISENIVSGNFEEAAKQLAQAAPMGLMGVMGERAKTIKDTGLPATASVLEGEALKPKVEAPEITAEQIEKGPMKPVFTEAPPKEEMAPPAEEQVQPPVSVAGEAPVAEPPAEVKPEAQPPTRYATEIRKEQEDDLGKYPPRDEARQAAEASRGYRPTKGRGEPEEVKPTRIYSAAYRPKGSDQIFTGPNHIEAMKAAGVEPELDASKRNTEEFGYTTDVPGQMISRKQANTLARENGQHLIGKDEDMKFPGVAHSNELMLDEYDEQGNKKIPAHQFRDNPSEVVKSQIAEPTEENIESKGMTRDDATQLGIVPKGVARTNFLIDGTKNFVQQITDGIRYRGKNIKNLRKAGVEDEANQHAAARIYVPHKVEELVGTVFGTDKDIDAMRPTMDILVKDDIVGGYEQIKSQIADTQAQIDDAVANKKPTQQLKNKLDNLQQRANDIAESHPIDQYKAEIESASPEIKGNIERWKRHVVPLMDQLYNELKNVDPNTERDGRGWKFGARLNLLSKTEEEKMKDYGDLDKPSPQIGVANYRNPNVKRDKFMRKATFLGDYSTDPVAILTNSLASRWNEVTKIRLYKALEDRGVGKIVDTGEEAPTQIAGKDAVRLPIKFPETNSETGVTKIVEKGLYVPKGLEDEIKRVLDVDSRPSQNPLIQAVTKTQVLGVADATAHLKNQQNIVRNSLGRNSFWKDLTAKVPFLGQAQSVKEIVDVAKEVAGNSQKIRDEKAYLAKIGALRPFYKSEGILDRYLPTHQLLHDTDTATRIILNRRYDELVKRYGAIDTESARRDFINQIGNYNRRLMGRWESRARDTGFSPFIVAGRAMNRYARKIITGDPGFKTDNTKGAIAARAAQMSGLVFATLVPAITNMFTTGNPFGRDGTPIGAIDFGQNFDTEDGKRRVFDVFAITGIRRGLRQFGIDAMIDGVRQGKDWRDIQREMASGAVTTTLHPWIGPGVGLEEETRTGKRLDLRTGYSQRYEARKIEGFNQYLENFRVGLKQLNPLLYGVAGRGVEWGMKDIAGIPYPIEERESKENLGLISKATGAPQVVGEIEAAIEKPVMGAVGYKEINTPAIQLLNSFGEATQFTPEQEQRFVYRRKIKENMLRGDINAAKDLFSQGLNDGILTTADQRSIARYAKYPEKTVQKFQMVKEADQAVRAWRVATPKEQDAVADIVVKKITATTSLTPQKKKALVDTFFKAAKKGTEVYDIAKNRKSK